MLSIHIHSITSVQAKKKKEIKNRKKVFIFFKALLGTRIKGFRALFYIICHANEFLFG